jgi:hypothetical protein
VANTHFLLVDHATAAELEFLAMTMLTLPSLAPPELTVTLAAFFALVSQLENTVKADLGMMFQVALNGLQPEHLSRSR